MQQHDSSTEQFIAVSGSEVVGTTSSWVIIKEVWAISYETRDSSSSKNHAFWGGIQIWCPDMENFLNLGGQNLGC